MSITKHHTKLSTLLWLDLLYEVMLFGNEMYNHFQCECWVITLCV